MQAQNSHRLRNIHSTIPGHVAVSLGGDQAIGLWSQPNNVNAVQRIRATDLPGTVYVGDPPW